MKSLSELMHDERVKKLEGELSRKGATCFTFIEYNEGKSRGEIDLIAIYDILPPKYEFYEVKCHNNPQRRKKAKEQFNRFLRAYGVDRDGITGYMVTCDGGRRKI
jgi:hypothetical protein